MRAAFTHTSRGQCQKARAALPLLLSEIAHRSPSVQHKRTVSNDEAHSVLGGTKLESQ